MAFEVIDETSSPCGFYFDKSKGRYRLSGQVKINGKRIRRTKLLPELTTEAEAAALAKALRVSLFSECAGLKGTPSWESEVNRAHATRGSWMHEMFNRAKGRAKKKRVPFTISLNDVRMMCIRSNGRCEISGLYFSQKTHGRGKMRPLVPSLDRRTPAEGYTIDNCRLVCACINVAMFSWGEATLRAVAVGLVVNQFFGDYLSLVLPPEVE